MFEIYLIIILFCLANSFKNRLARYKYLNIYFIIVFVSESLVYFELMDRKNYYWLNILYMIFFCWYYLIE